MEGKKEWCTVNDYVTLVRGTTYKGNLVGEPGPALLGLGSIEPGGGFREGHYKTYGGDCPAKLMLLPGDLYVSLKGATKDGTMIGSVARVPNTVSSGRLTQDTVKLEFRNPDPEDVSYLYWILRTPHYRTYCAKRATGSAVVALSRQDFLGYPIPPLNFLRKQLVTLFEGIDRKIENLRRQNETLERIAQTLFKQWFVDFEFPFDASTNSAQRFAQDRPFDASTSSAQYFAQGKPSADCQPYKSSGGAMQPSELGEIPAGWRVGKLGDEVKTLGGGTPSTKEPDYWVDGDIPWYSPTDLTKSNTLFSLSSEKQITRLGLDKSSAKLFPAYSILLTSRATIGEITINTKPACTNQGFITLVPNDNFSVYFLHGWLLTQINLIKQLASGSTFPELSKSTFRNFLFLIPKPEVLEKYNHAIEPLFKKVENNIRQIQTLTKTRDALLPKLMSGQLRIGG